MNIDLSPIMQAVEDVIARHERYIGYGKAREARKKLRIAQKGEAIVRAYEKSVRDMSQFPWQASWAATAFVTARVSAIRSSPSSLFCTDKPEIDPARYKAFLRAERATTVSINYKGAPGYDASGLVDRLNSELKGSTIQ